MLKFLPFNYCCAQLALQHDSISMVTQMTQVKVGRSKNKMSGHEHGRSLEGAIVTCMSSGKQECSVRTVNMLICGKLS